MKVLELLEEIEEIVDTASGFPLTGKITDHQVSISLSICKFRYMYLFPGDTSESHKFPFCIRKLSEL